MPTASQLLRQDTSNSIGSNIPMGSGGPASQMLGASPQRKSIKPDVSTLEGLQEFASQEGFEKEAKISSTEKLSLLQRIGRGLTSFETGNSFYQERYNKRSFLKTYGQDIKKGLTEAFTGHDQGKEKKTFKDILLKETELNDRPGKMDVVDVVGLMGDIVFDPTTFFGGLAGKGITKSVKAGSRVLKKAPVVGRAVSGVEETAKGLFKPFHKIEKLGKTGQEYRDSFLKYAKGTRAEINDFMADLAGKAKGLKKSVGKKEFKRAGVKIGEAIETGSVTGNKFIDEIMDSLVDVQKSMTAQEAKRGILKSQLPDYMHHMLTTEAADFLAHNGDLSGYIKPVRVKLGAAKQRKISGIITDINKTYREKLGFNLFEEDAFKAFSKRGVNSIKAVSTYDFLERVGKQFGKKAKKGIDALPPDEFGIKWVRPAAGGGKLAPKAIKDVLLPEPIAKHLDEMNKVLTSDEATTALLKHYDKALNIFKASVTGWFPAFHTRNAMGGMFNNFIAGVKNPAEYVTARNILKGKGGNITVKGGKKVSYDTIRQLIKENGVVGQTGYLDVAQFLQKEVSPTAASTIKKLPQIVMGHVEDHLRVPLFVDGLKKGLKPTEAARRVIQFHFDYMPEGFTAFERTAMKRIIPFYTWTRHNIPLQIEQIVKQPGKYAGVFKVQNAWGAEPSSEEENVLPIWLRERFTIKSEGGYWAGIGLPLEEATEKLSSPLRGFGISMSPFIKIPFEQLTGVNIFKGKKIDEDRYGKYYKNMPKPIKDWLKLKEHKSKSGKVYYTVDPRRKYWVEAIGMRGWNTAIRVANGLSEKKERLNLLSLMTTIKRYNYTFDDLKRWSDFDKKKELEAALIRAGKLQQFKRAYIPKGGSQ